eukprot:8821389-Pyramimonas_sp.AAC.1
MPRCPLPGGRPSAGPWPGAARCRPPVAAAAWGRRAAPPSTRRESSAAAALACPTTSPHSTSHMAGRRP